jgi:hypothetical protein
MQAFSFLERHWNIENQAHHRVNEPIRGGRVLGRLEVQSNEKQQV